ncbi:MAG TPA: ATP-binding protein [Candidatus Saccharimonadales bacterium]|nr:ATP-binding protein [Candidatus Saccharimonadales bacterium]
MRLQLRFLMVMAALFVVAALLILLGQKFELDRSKSLLANTLGDRRTYVLHIINLDGQSEQAFDEDYSFWDDMVNFIKTDDVTFAHQNLDTGLSTFNTDADWVYRPNGSLVYFSSASGSNALQSLGLPTSFFTQLNKAKFAHFYTKDDGTLLEIRAATVVGSNDPNHDTPAQGYLLIGRIIGNDYASSISSLSGSTIKIGGVGNNGNIIGKDTVSFADTLNSWNGKPVALLRSTSTVTAVADQRQQDTRQLQIVTVLTFVAISIIMALIWLLVLKPTTILNKAISLKRPELLRGLAKQNTEFGTLASTVEAFFHQKVSLEQAEFRKTELEKLNKEKADFLAVAAHELNHPVSNVKIFAEFLTFLLRDPNHRDEKAIAKQVRAIGHQSTRINMLLNDLYASSSGKQGLEFNLRDFDFDTFIRDEVEESRFSIKNKINLFSETRVTVHSDPDRLGQVVANLIRNAVKYSPEGGDILVRAKDADGGVQVSIQDFGVGIAPEDIPHLFERFYRSSRISSTIPGLGLGLNISKTIIESLGGRIWVESTLGKGTTFHFSIPLKAEAVVKTHETAPEPDSPEVSA